MKYKCQECNDTGSRDKSGDYLDCGHCDAAMQRKALNDWLASQYHQGAIAKVDSMDAWLIHQRALAMAPKQEADHINDVVKMVAPEGWRLVPVVATYEMERAAANGPGRSTGAHMESQSLIWKSMLDAAPAAPAAANGAMPELPDPLEIYWPELHSSALGCGVEDRGLRDRYECAEYGWQDGVDKAAACVPDAIYDADQMRAYDQACHSMGRGAAVREYIENGTFKHPVPANGALTDEQIVAICEKECGWLAGAKDKELVKFARAILAAAGPDAALVKALKTILKSTGGVEDLPIEGMWLSDFCRAALSGAKGN